MIFNWFKFCPMAFVAWVVMMVSMISVFVMVVVHSNRMDREIHNKWKEAMLMLINLAERNCKECSKNDM